MAKQERYPPVRGIIDWVSDFGGDAIVLQVEPGLRVSWLGHLLRSIMTFGAYDYWRLWDPRMTYRPRIVAVNRRGQHFTVVGASGPVEATEKLERLRREIEQLPLDVWCDRYGLPSGFVEGLWRPGQFGHEGLVGKFLDRERERGR